jgi:hypothetical protein
MPGQPTINPWLTFDVTSMSITETGAVPPVLPPYTVIPRNTGFRLAVDFSFAAALAPWLVSLNLSWTARFFYESIGPGPENTFGQVSGNTTTGKLLYGAPETNLIVSGGMAIPGLYRITASVSVGGPTPSPISGFVEGPMIQIT